jgi:DNA helicase-2/ATP-dependent DNA helicase PcrA
MNPSSRFIEEINEEYIENSGVKETKKIKKEEKFYEEDLDIKVGDHVYHDTYKRGIVVSVDEYIATIAFSHNIGIKKLMKNHKSLRKEQEKL